MPVPSTVPHKHPLGRDAAVPKELNFPPEIDYFIHEMCVTAMLRAIENGTYVPPPEDQQPVEDE